jgi:hypothetical protein
MIGFRTHPDPRPGRWWNVAATFHVVGGGSLTMQLHEARQLAEWTVALWLWSTTDAERAAGDRAT